MDVAPPELSQLDEVLLLTREGLVGRALVVGPVQPADPFRLLLPVLVTNLFPPLRIDLPGPVAAWLAGAGGNPRLLSAAEHAGLATS